jgi:hypothetical protein
MNISYCIGACIEYNELDFLLNILKDKLQDNDEIVVVLDNPTKEVLNITDKYKSVINVFEHQLNNDFSQHKNFMTSVCKGDFIFNIDADEYPSNTLLSNIKLILENNKDRNDILAIPRINIIHDIDEEHLIQWGWKVSVNETYKHTCHKTELSSKFLELITKNNLIIHQDQFNISYYYPLINYPDYQTRIYRNCDYIKWNGVVHERLVGTEKIGLLPYNPVGMYSLHHLKQLNKQISQIELYHILWHKNK